MTTTERGRRTRSAVWPVAAVLAGAIALSGCSGSKQEAGGTSATPSNAPAASGAGAANPFAKHLDITWLGYNQAGGKVNDKLDSPTKKMIEAKFNVTINQVILDIHKKELVSLYFAEGKTADYIALNVDFGFLADQGLLKKVPQEKMYKVMPEWMKMIETMLDPKVLQSSMKYKGENYYVPTFNHARLQPHIMAIRKDWLDNVGIAKLPETMEEYHEVLKRFTFNDPDKNGKDDTFGSHGIQLYLRGAYGFGKSNEAFYADQNGKVYPVAISDGFKQYLKTLQAWNKEGLIDPESITDQRAQQRQKWAAGKFGIIADHPSWFAASTVGNLTKMLADKNPNGRIEFLQPFAGPGGEKASGNLNYPAAAFGFAFGKDTSDEKMERIMAIKEALITDNDFYMKVFYGDEGTMYTRDQDGIVKVLPEYLTVDKINELGTNNYFGNRPKNWDYVTKETIFKADRLPYELALKIPVKYNDVNFPLSGTNAAFEKYGVAIATVALEFETNAIGGKLDIDKDWEAYKKKFLDAGGQAIMEEYQKQYDAIKK
ncbi:DUF3502 domain-containing protein [Paenibacillus cymbidii]|uniref:DUF3502 domain-containing protein n=1 Tax=Paenibacillus cymbidii TaxID=1639034 RepID=UPI0010803CAB|nr:DUF3502 domain-containing protein [Paenibacillus cymbidii]